MQNGSMEKLGRRIKSSLKGVLQLLAPASQFSRAVQMGMAGHRITNEQSVLLENRLLASPNNLKMRMILLGYYMHLNFDLDASIEKKRLNHIQWIVENRPAHAFAGLPEMSIFDSQSPEDYRLMKGLWLRQVEKHNRNHRVQANAASFFTHADKELAERCYLNAIVCCPRDRKLRHSLAHLYSMWDGHEKQAVAQLEKIGKFGNSDDRFYELTNLPYLAFEAGEFDKSERTANQLLELSKKHRHNWNYGNAVNKAHTVLGRLSMRRGEIEKARRHLKESSIDIASPQTQSFGPTLDLAKELLKAGQVDSVLSYLDAFDFLCGPNNQEAFELRFEIQTGLEPDYVYTEVREKFEQSFLDHVFNSLKQRAPGERIKHCKRAIERVKSQYERCLMRAQKLDEQIDDTQYQIAENKKRRLREHLFRLEELLPYESNVRHPRSD